MSRKGESIFFRNDNRWEARYVKGYTDSGKTIYGYVYDKTYIGVKKKRNKILLDLNKQSHSKNSSKDKLANKMDLWLSNQQYNVKESTYAHYWRIIENHLKPSFGNLNVSELTLEKLTVFRNRLLVNLSPKTVSDIVTLLKKILRDNDILIPLKTPRINKRSTQIMSKDDWNKLNNYLLNHLNTYSLGVYICMYTGLRLGEICALKWKDIDLEKKIIRISHTIIRVKDFDSNNKTKIIISDPKTDNAIREIPITSTLECLLKEFKKDGNDDYYVLTGTNKYIETRNYYNKYKTILKHANTNNYNFHTLRHTFATRCVEIGVDVKSLSEILGHSDIKITLAFYVHPNLETKKFYMEKLCLL